jgi:FKBP-type peptidyl-prolyl cis-trans isomerase SlyD
MQIVKNSVVMIDYTLRDGSGKVIDTSVGKAPLAYLHGGGAVIPGLEKALEGKKAGDNLKVTVSPEEGYGLRDESLVQVVPSSAFGGAEVKVGSQFRTQSPQGNAVVTVTKIEGDKVTVDANHALAGMDLAFEVDVKSVRKATQEELLHGHVHGPGGHHHH